nr:MAG TPA: hypothetical protein [Caudoviricetes sp.]
MLAGFYITLRNTQSTYVLFPLLIRDNYLTIMNLPSR